METLKELPDKVKDCMYLYHVAEKDLPKDFGLKGIQVGLHNTIAIIEDMPETPNSNLELLCSLELVNWLPLSRIPEVLACFKERKYKEGEVII